MSAGLLDVNVLLALTWPTHIHHHAARGWLAKHRGAGWATCPMTECGFVRISSNPNFSAHAVAPREALALLRQLVEVEGHVFWEEAASPRDESMPTKYLVGHRQVADVYLLGVAIQHGGRLVTLDKNIASLVPGASPYRDSLEIIDTGER